MSLPIRLALRLLCALALLCPLGETAAVVAQETETPTSLPRGDAPPWDVAQAGPPKLPVQELAGPRQLLELFNVDSSLLSRFADGRPLHPDEYETLYRVLYRIPRFLPHDLLRWRSDEWDWEAVLDQPEEYRADSVRLTGRVRRVEREALIPEAARVLEYDHFYRVLLQPDQAPLPVVVCAREVPQAWKVGQEVDYRASVEGLFLKVGQNEQGEEQLLVACNRVAWHPERPAPTLGVTEDRVLLASRGMDLGQFDLVRDRLGLSGAERECFYQMLYAASRIDPATLKARSAGEADLAPLLQSPATARGEIVAFTGEIRRVHEIQITEKDVQLRFGLRSYYEVDVFVPLENQTIKMGEGEDAPVFENYYPVIFCVAALPKGFQPDELVHREALIPAYFFKLWAYETEFMKRHGDRSTQISPMLIGHTLHVLPPPALPTGAFGTAAALIFVAVLGLTWMWVWLTGKKDSAVHREIRNRRLRTEGKTLNDLPAPDAPDFRGLADADTGPREET